MTKTNVMPPPIPDYNLLIAKADALDALIDNGFVDKETIINIADEDWFGDMLADKWGIKKGELTMSKLKPAVKVIRTTKTGEEDAQVILYVDIDKTVNIEKAIKEMDTFRFLLESAEPEGVLNVTLAGENVFVAAITPLCHSQLDKVTTALNRSLEPYFGKADEDFLVYVNDNNSETPFVCLFLSENVPLFHTTKFGTIGTLELIKRITELSGLEFSEINDREVTIFKQTVSSQREVTKEGVSPSKDVSVMNEEVIEAARTLVKFLFGNSAFDLIEAALTMSPKDLEKTKTLKTASEKMEEEQL